MTFHYKIKKVKKIKNAIIVSHSKNIDNRGYISSIFSRQIQKKVIGKKFNNYIDKVTFRKKNVLTGIHGDNKTWKVLTCISGKILLIIVNCNLKSKNFGNYFKIILNEKKKQSIVIPPYIGNSFLCLSSSIVHYKTLFNGNYNDTDRQFTFKWNDPRFKLPWNIKNPILSKRDEFQV